MAAVKRRPGDDEPTAWARRMRKNGYDRATNNCGRRRGRQVGKDWDLSLNDLLVLIQEQTTCPYLGVEWDFVWNPNDDAANWRYPTLDRIDHTQGYVRGNVRVVSWWANRSRGQLDDKTFKRLCESAASRL